MCMFTQLLIGGVSPVAMSKVLKNLTVGVHYLNEYLKKTWGLGPTTLESSMTFEQRDAANNHYLGAASSHASLSDNERSEDIENEVQPAAKGFLYQKQFLCFG